ncbi:hypothetical protein CAPTEDRAFT_209014 [Capitella teleta]|uniref:Uncharacterized protein n=1 Tax=Capitella teleta TaxID=283909 RepID=R7UZL1_CAPTE|nr:hypothetical protein CAPTEDRAFT_209014 [Capitella teleta]|eukprot:ELU11667.1 hypothetical protein CAPTEDRAFT_209014 [Capitella teleta]
MDCVYLVLLLAGSGSVLGGDPVMVFRCQAACLVDAQERGVPVVKDQDACSTDGDCDLCWKICEHLVQDPMNWAPNKILINKSQEVQPPQRHLQILRFTRQSMQVYSF